MRTVLVVEDEPILRATTEMILRELGYTVVVAQTGEEALSLAIATPELHLLFTDINLGAGVSGWHVAKQTRITHPAVRVIYCSGLAGVDDHLQFGVERSVLLLKPYEAGDLTVALQNATGDAG